MMMRMMMCFPCREKDDEDVDDDEEEDDCEDDDELPMQGCVMRDRGEFSSGGYSERRDCSIAPSSKYNDTHDRDDDEYVQSGSPTECTGMYTTGLSKTK